MPRWWTIIGIIVLMVGVWLDTTDVVAGYILFWIGLVLSWPWLIKLLRKIYASFAWLAMVIVILIFVFVMALVLPSAAFVAAGGSITAFTVGVIAASPKSGSSNINAVEGLSALVLICLLVGGTEFLTRKLAFRDASELTRKLGPSVIAAAAATMTCIYLFLLHFSAGPLAGIKPGSLIAALLAVAVLISPVSVSSFGRSGNMALSIPSTQSCGGNHCGL